MEVSQNALVRAAGVPPRRINAIVLGKRGISFDTAVRLTRVFGTSERFWLGPQVDYDLEEARNAIAATSQTPIGLPPEAAPANAFVALASLFH